MLSEEKERIPGFIGGILSRREKGDHEAYCSTMLTLFNIRWPYRLGTSPAKPVRDDSGTQSKYVQRCSHCNREETPLIKWSMCTLAATRDQTTLAAEIEHRFNRVSTQPCRTCRQVKVNETLEINKDNPPLFMAIQLVNKRQQGEGACQPKMTSQVTIRDSSDKLTYKLRGLIY